MADEDFSTSAALSIAVDQTSLRDARQEVENSIGSVTVDVSGARSGATGRQPRDPNTGRFMSQEGVEQRLVDLTALDERRNELLQELVDETERAGDGVDGGGRIVRRFGDGGGGGGGGGLGGIIGGIGLLGLAGAIGAASSRSSDVELPPPVGDPTADIPGIDPSPNIDIPPTGLSGTRGNRVAGGQSSIFGLGPGDVGAGVVAGTAAGAAGRLIGRFAGGASSAASGLGFPAPSILAQRVFGGQIDVSKISPVGSAQAASPKDRAGTNRSGGATINITNNVTAEGQSRQDVERIAQSEAERFADRIRERIAGRESPTGSTGRAPPAPGPGSPGGGGGPQPF